MLRPERKNDSALFPDRHMPATPMPITDTRNAMTIAMSMVDFSMAD
jgi:hypothetical protein